MAIPWNKLVSNFKISEHKKGRNCLFSPKGRLGLMFLKHYSNCSDRKLIEQLNSNLDYQFFCDIPFYKVHMHNNVPFVLFV